MPESPLVIVYAYDPLCGWCFAFGPAMEQVRHELAGEVFFEPACGGLVTGERVRPVGVDRDYLVAGLAQVEQRTGVRAGAAYLDGLLAEGTWVSDSEPPCRALRVALDLADEGAGGATVDRVLDLGHALTRALYVDGRRPDEADTVRDCADGAGIDGALLVERWRTPQARTATQDWFATTRAAGVTTYPSLFLRHGERLVPLCAGSVTAREAVATVRRTVELVGAP